MAGIYIPGIEMPKPEMVLDVKVYSNGLVTVWDKKVGWIRHHAVPVPDHGRLVMLPCKVGDMVYYRRGRDIIGDTVGRIIIGGIDNQVLVGAHRAYMFCDFGRNVFLTREESEAALKGGQTDV